MGMHGLYTVAEVAKECGLVQQSVLYHIREGRIPEPLRWGGRRLWTEDQRRNVVAYFKGRQRYERTRTAR